MSNQFSNMMKQMQQVQAKLAEAQSKISQIEVTGISGGGVVSITLNGSGHVTSIKIDKSIVSQDDVSVLEDLIVAADANARVQLEQKVKESNPLTDLLPPGMKLPF